MTESMQLSSPLTCDEADELAGVYVLGAIDDDERERVRSHLDSCPREHAEFAQLGSVVPALALIAEPVEAPPELKSRILAAYAAETRQAPRAESVQPRAQATQVWSMDGPQMSARPAQRSWLGWAAAGMAVLMLAALGTWGLMAQARADVEAQRAATLADAVRVFAATGSEVAVLRGSGAAEGASGFAAFAPEGEGYVVVAGLPELPSDQTYQAWYLVDGTPVSAGLMAVDRDGLSVLARIPHHAGTEVIALTREPAGGAAAPTSDPIVVGEVTVSA